MNATQTSGDVRFILQRINSGVFKDPAALMENVRRVTEHLRSKRTKGHAALSLVPATDGSYFHVDECGAYWRMYRFLERSRSYDSIRSVAHARAVAAEFGRFQAMLRDLPGPRLHETIADFHDTPARYLQFHEARTRDAQHRASHCMREIDQALAFEECAASLLVLLESGEVPERITHNDTKINNVVFDLHSDTAVCVIDLDTVMPGLALYDFGDMVRTATTTAAEDETNLSMVTMRMDYYEALVDGYLSTAGSFLNDVEVDNLALSGKVITIETGIRFLCDYLCGDRYFRVHYPDHNLDRCKAQFALAASIDEQLSKMQQLTMAAFQHRH